MVVDHRGARTFVGVFIVLVVGLVFVVSPGITAPDPTIQEMTPTISPTRQVTPFRASHYDPALGGTNCSNFVNGKCISHMASGMHWEEYMDWAIACDRHWPFWTVFVFTSPPEIAGKKWVCLDRGGAIVNDEGIEWVDFLHTNEGWNIPYGAIIYGYTEVP